MSSSPRPKRITNQQLNDANEKILSWSARLAEKEEKINRLEQLIAEKEILFSQIENNLSMIEQRQAQFDELLEKYEKESEKRSSAASNRISRREAIEKAKLVFETLNEHKYRLEEAENRQNPTLKDMIYLVADIRCRFSRLKRQALESGVIAPALQIEEEDIPDYVYDEEEEDYEQEE